MKSSRRPASGRIPAGLFFAMVAFILVVGFFFINFQNKKIALLESDANALEQERHDKERRNESLRREIEYSSSEDYIDQVAREKMHWAHEDELMFIDPKDSQPQQTPAPAIDFNITEEAGDGQSE